MKAISALLFAAAVAPLHAQQPDAAAMVRSIRLSATLQQMDLTGSVEKSGGPKLGLNLFIRDKNMQFQLGDKERFHIRMGDERAELLNVIDDKGTTRAFPASKLSDSIAGTDVSYEDLTLRFLYWPNAKLEGEEKANSEQCYKIRLDNPGKDGAYGVVYVWVHKKHGAFWQIRAHDRKGTPMKEFQVNSVMKMPSGGYTIKEMRVNALDSNSRVKAITYLRFNEPAAAGPKGRGR
ncbi:outer membrane lipoprotein-sorting protein [Luteolibacter flavescens]|uniref:Outer membrane lipoprotein-sorting protein n=1 Tax=Luteolibacter flavescens TaxID=1859460 RepID=A0ABT3FJF3_9BACT|nr:outer membrane lipoprotein-sorting protein [Luteolibacter flavescens]MCW1883696.1 outer membrane lipoprotein-sorting protein [Luteolibacter flavescens]